MLCVRRLRSTGLPMSWGDVCDSICLTRAVTHDPSTGVRATTSLGGERVQQAAYSLPSQRFSLALSFPQPSPLLWRTSQLYISHDFSRQISFLCVLCSIMEVCSFGCYMEGDGEGGKRGTGGENPEGEGGLQPGCPPSPGLSPQASGKPVLRVPSTQSIKSNAKGKGN